MLKKLITHSFLYSLAPQVPKIASLFLMPVITQYLRPVDYGIYGIITSYLFFVTAFKDLGFATVFVNTFYKYPRRWPLIWRMLHGHLLLWGIIYAGILVILLAFTIPKEAMHNFFLIATLTIIPAVLFDNTNLLGNYYFRFSQKPMFITIVSIVTGVAAIAITFVCVVNLRLGYLSWFFATFGSSLVMFLFYCYPVYGNLRLWPILRIRKRFIRPHLKVALPMIPHNYSSYLLNSSDRIVMDLYKVDIRRIGLYNIAYQFGNYFEALGEAIGMAVGPFYSKLYSQKRSDALKDARDMTFFLMGLFLTTTFLTALWLKEFFMLLIHNAELRSAYDIGILIIMGYAYRPMYWSAGIKLSIYEKTSLLWRISFVAGALNVVLNIIFVPFFGIYAAAVITLISLLYIGFAGYFLKSYRRLEGPNHYPIYWMTSIIICSVSAYLLRDAAIGMKVVVTAIVLGIAIYFFRKNLELLMKIQI